MNESVKLRTASLSDVPIMQSLEVDAARRYGTMKDYEFCTQLPPRSRAEHIHVQEHGAAWLVGLGDKVIGFLLALPVDGRAHVLEVATEYGSQGKGFGRRLFAEFHSWAADIGYSEVTLTTYRDVPWNAPFYERMGYQIIAVDARRPELMTIRAEEAAAGFDRAPRVAMERPLRARAIP